MNLVLALNFRPSKTFRLVLPSFQTYLVKFPDVNGEFRLVTRCFMLFNSVLPLKLTEIESDISGKMRTQFLEISWYFTH
jgi:hypothetical protein